MSGWFIDRIDVTVTNRIKYLYSRELNTFLVNGNKNDFGQGLTFGVCFRTPNVTKDNKQIIYSKFSIPLESLTKINESKKLSEYFHDFLRCSYRTFIDINRPKFVIRELTETEYFGTVDEVVYVLYSKHIERFSDIIYRILHKIPFEYGILHSPSNRGKKKSSIRNVFYVIPYVNENPSSNESLSVSNESLSVSNESLSVSSNDSSEDKTKDESLFDSPLASPIIPPMNDFSENVLNISNENVLNTSNENVLNTSNENVLNTDDSLYSKILEYDPSNDFDGFVSYELTNDF